jgi:hypothetical protein
MLDDAKIRHQATPLNGEATNALVRGEIDADAHVLDESETEITPDSGPPDSREAELKWIDEHIDNSPELAGKWIVLNGAKLISSNMDLSAAIDKARNVGVDHPFVFRVPNDRNNPVSP